MRHFPGLLLAGIAAVTLTATPAIAAPSRTAVLSTMKRATQFMVEKASVNGGYVWSYLPDMSRRWGEMEAYPTMVWVQPPGTGTMGHLFLDAYHATGDEYYYRAAEKAADALIAGQQPEGGWHYFIDFGGKASTAKWYATIGKNAWRLEEFQHYWGNATFDDAGTSEAMQFLLRLYIEKHDAKYLPALQKSINFVLKSQYPNGGWPQRYPATKFPYIDHGKPDYTGFITFNDDVAGENIRFLIQVWQTLGDKRVLGAIDRAMDIYVRTQQPAPQAGWGLQYTLDLKPSGARTYEPTAIVTHTTYANIEQLLSFYRLTGDPKFLKRIPEALDWLDSVKSPPELNKDGKTYPTFLEIGTNRPLYVHRRGSNVVNGEYYVDDNPKNTLGHYGSFRHLDVAKLRREYEELKATPPAVASKDSPLKSATRQPLDRYYLTEMGAGSDRNSDLAANSPDALVASLNASGWWPTELKYTSNRYARDGSKSVTPGDYATTRVGDETDTSPYPDPKPVIGISTGTYIAHMEKLIAALGDANKALLIGLFALAGPALAQTAPVGRMTIIDGDSVKRDEPPPHGNIGMSTAYRLSDAVPNRAMEFRKRILHVGAAIGSHVIDHDEVYYVLSGTGEAFSGDRKQAVRAGQAIYFFSGETMGIRQTGREPLALIISYPLATRAK